MATFAPTGNVLMTCDKKRCRGENNSGIVTSTALLLCRDVINNLRRCDTSGMAGRAVVSNVTVVKSRARKRVRTQMTNGTIVGRRHVISR